MVVIYCIEDINDLKYIGSTVQKLNDRLSHHRYNKVCSSRKLNLYNCIIYELETCSDEQRRERERFHINNTDCVNINKLNFDPEMYRRQDGKEYAREWRLKNKEKIREKQKEYEEKNKDKIKKRKQDYYIRKKQNSNAI